MIHKNLLMRINFQGNNYLTLQENKHTNTIFVVDEASMIPDASDKGFEEEYFLTI